MTITPTWDTLALDQSLALRSAAGRLAEEFDGIYGSETIERFLHSSFDQFAGRATVAHFLPLMVERFASQRLVAWVLNDPAGLDLAAIRPIRDELERRVLALLAELELPVATAR